MAEKISSVDPAGPVPKPGPDAPDHEWEVYHLDHATRNVDEAKRLHEAGAVDSAAVARAQRELDVVVYGRDVVDARERRDASSVPLPAPERPPVSVPSHGAGRSPSMDR